MKDLAHILIIETAWLGDVILSTSLAETIHARYPACKIDYLISNKWSSVFKDHPYLNKVYTIDKSEKRKSIPALIKALRNKTYDLVVNNHRHTSSAIIAHCIKANERSGYSNAPFSFLYTYSTPFNTADGRHVADRMMDLLDHVPELTKQPPRLYPPDSHLFMGMEKYICISPFSAWYTKTWPPAKWAELIDALPETTPVFLMGGPGDYENAEIIIKASRQRTSEIKNLCGQVSMLESIAIMRDAKMNYVLDSAPLHMCSAVNAPVTALYLSTSPSYGFSPLSTQAGIVQTKQNLPCKPCGIHGKKKCPEGHFKCSDISIDQLL